MLAFELRAWRADDLDALVRHANDPGVADNMTDGFPHPYTEEAGLRFLDMALAAPERLRCIAVAATDAPIGAIGIHPQADIMRRNAELGYWLARPYWGQGIVTEAVRRMVEHGFAHFPVDRIFARPFGTNTASQRVLEKAGFTLEARLHATIIKNGRIEDELIYAVRR